MNKNIKQIYSTIKIDDGQLQILTAEYFNTRFNIINTYSSQLSCISGYTILDNVALVSAIKDGIDVVSNKIGSRLEKVILVLPSYNFKRISLKVSVIPNDGILKKVDVARALTNSLKTNVGDGLAIISTLISRYTVNGISTRRFPDNETCEEAILDIDLLCADKEMAYSYVEAVTNAGLDILDICLNSYAISKESVALANSINQNIVLLEIGNEITYLTLLSKGRVASSEVIYDGLSTIYKKVNEQFRLPMSVIPRLLKYNVDFESQHGDDSIYAWNDGNESKSLTVKELSDFVERPVNEYVEKLMMMCKPIIEQGVNFVLCGEGSSMNALVKKIRLASGCEVKSYYPDTIGIRNSNMCALYGSMFIYKEKADLNNLDVTCVNIVEYEKVLNNIEIDEESQTITSKIKSIFDAYRNNKGE